MVNVRLARDWTDKDGSAHGGGDMVDVDPVTLAELEESGVVAGAGVEPTGSGDEERTVAWAGPTDDQD